MTNTYVWSVKGVEASSPPYCQPLRCPPLQNKDMTVTQRDLHGGGSTALSLRYTPQPWTLLKHMF